MPFLLRKLEKSCEKYTSKKDLMLLYKPISKREYLMKIFIGENRSCGLNYQHDLIFNELSFKYEITDDSKDYLKMINTLQLLVVYLQEMNI